MPSSNRKHKDLSENVVVPTPEQAGVQGEASRHKSSTNSDDSLAQRREKAITEYLAEVPAQFHGVYMRAVRGESRTSAVTVFCLECVGFQPGEVRGCTDLRCPLWAFRPYRPRTRDSEVRR